MKNKKTIFHFLVLALIMFLPGIASAYNTFGGWPGATTTYYTTGGSSNSAFDSAAIDALNNWNGLSNFSYSNTSGYKDPCNNPNSSGPPYFNGWEFRSDLCGAAFGGGTLGVNISWTSSAGVILQAGTVFSNAWPYDVHSGSGANFDFKRAATHEFGHALGMGHDNTFSALMNTTYSQTIETPQTDDINGLRAIYGGTGAGTGGGSGGTPVPAITANGSSSDISINTGTTLTIAISLDAMGNTSAADWWLIVTTPFGTYYLDLTLGWTLGSSVTLQANLADLGPTTVLSMSTLPAGIYTFYVGVDTKQDGSITPSNLQFKKVVVIVN